MLDHFRLTYGEKILSAPTTTGFNIVAWVTPFAAVFVAAAMVVIVGRRWRKAARRRRGARRRRPAVDEREAARRAVLEDELRRFDA